MDVDGIAKSSGSGDLFIAGRWRPAADGRTFPVADPATGEVIREVSSAGSRDSAAAVDAAARALDGWRSTAPRRRSEILHDVFSAMRDHADELARLITLENGKAYRDARAEVFYAAEFFRWFAEEAVRVGSGFGDAPAGGYRQHARGEEPHLEFLEEILVLLFVLIHADP